MRRRRWALLRATLALCCYCVCAGGDGGSLYDVLGVTESATAAEIKKAYYKLAQKLHPDKARPEEKDEAAARFKKVAEAHATLSSPERRSAYDRERRGEAKPRQQLHEDGQPMTAVEAARAAVKTVEGVGELRQLCTNRDKQLQRHMLLALYDTRSAKCLKAVNDTTYPYPFSGWSQEWHGIWWEEFLVPVGHDVAPSLEANGASPMLSLFGVATKRTRRGVIMEQQCPIFVVQLPGEQLGVLPSGQRRVASTDDPGKLQDWVWSLLQIQLVIRNLHTRTVRINWIHGAHVNEIRTLAPGMSFTQTVFLSHTLHAEDVNRKGNHISENSSLIIFHAVRAGEEMVIKGRCADASADCEYWMREGECQRNQLYMSEECPLSCNFCKDGQAHPCVDDERCAEWAKDDHCVRNRRFMAATCRRACGWCDAPDDGSAGQEACSDEDIRCETWVDQGECKKNPNFMNAECRRSCKACSAQAPAAPAASRAADPSCKDSSGKCDAWAKDDHCVRNRRFMAVTCRRACGWCDAPDDGSAGQEACSDEDIRCETWFAQGECKKNPGFMNVECRRSCDACSAAPQAAPAAAGASTAVDPSCKDSSGKCDAWAKDDHCVRNRRFMAVTCRRACGWCSAAEDGSTGKAACSDEDIKCETWVGQGECKKNPDFMNVECRRSCKVCTVQAQSAAEPAASRAADPSCKDSSGKCDAWAKDDHCVRNRRFMAATCRRACGWCDAPDDGSAGQEACSDEDIRCEKWFAQGECKKNPGFMNVECRRSCDACSAAPQAAPAAAGASTAVDPSCKDSSGKCDAWAKDDHCVRNRRFMAVTCRRACGWCSAAEDGSAGKEACSDEDIKCETWVGQGECKKNPSFMKSECRRSCKVCSTAPSQPRVHASTPPEDCVDRFKDCESMARAPDGCTARFMTRNCRATCRLCGGNVKDEL